MLLFCLQFSVILHVAASLYLYTHLLVYLILFYLPFLSTYFMLLYFSFFPPLISKCSTKVLFPPYTTQQEVVKCFAPVSGPVMGWRAVESFHSSEQTITRRHWRWEPDVFRVQRFIITVLKLGKGQEKRSMHFLPLLVFMSFVS